MRDTLICTVGTSLFGNLRNSEEQIKDPFQTQNWNRVALLLLQQENSSRICGAEINSITSICRQHLLDSTEKLIFLVSDTEDGGNAGQVLKLYYENSRNPIQFREVQVRKLEGLRDDDVHIFQQQGLKNLVREISVEVRKFSPDALAINATGGYKAQISFAGMIGQALNIPVYYLFERFSKVIQLPPQPVSLDLGFWLENYLVFEQLEFENVLKKTQLDGDIANEYWKTLIDEEIDEHKPSEVYISLSAMGTLFHERSRLQFAKQETTLLSLIPKDSTSPDRKSIHLRDDHGKDILHGFAKKICCSHYVKEVINSLPFNPNHRDPIQKTTSDGKVNFILTWTDAGLGLCIQTTGRNKSETNSIAIYLKEKFVE
jgi:putative CRISPR-associated protein (TIGR02619 family)